MFKITKYASYYVKYLIESGMVLYEYSYIHLISNDTCYFKNKIIYMYTTMNGLTDNLVDKFYAYYIGDKTHWKSKFKNVIHEITF